MTRRLPNEVPVPREVAVERLARIESILGSLVLHDLPPDVEVAILTAWWDSRVDVPDDDPLRVAMLAERREILGVES